MKRITLITTGIVAALAVGCATQRVQRASIVDFLYPNKERPVETATIPTLSLPMDVGIVFVPEKTPYQESALTEKEKIALMERVGAQFKAYPFIRSVNPIPTQYLRPGGGFPNLEEVGTMFGVDVIVVLSYDQAQFTDQHQLAALSYWTLVGAYVVPAERNTTHTMIDAAVYHLPSHKMLFRAPGISRVQRNSTPVDLVAALREDEHQGFTKASDDLTISLKQQLDVFREKARKAPDEYKVVAKTGYDLKAVGELDGVTLMLLAVLAGATCLGFRNQHSCGQQGGK
jgi:rhombotail lipoprotein